VLNKNILSKIGHAKAFIQRPLSYMSIVNGIMLLFLTFGGLRDIGLNIDMKIWFVPIMFIGIILLIFLGWLEDKLGMYEAETAVAYSRSPQIIETLENSRINKIEIREIKNEIQELKKIIQEKQRSFKLNETGRKEFRVEEYRRGLQ